VNTTGGKVSVQAIRGDQTIVTSGMVFAFKYIKDPMLEAKRQKLMKIWMP
jgi:CRISPR/Cas system-associated exonuclease Cas4 (RecB family)